MAPKITEFLTSVSVYEGETLFLPCLFQGFPLPTSSWFHSTTPSSSTSLSLGGFIGFSPNTFPLSSSSTSSVSSPNVRHNSRLTLLERAGLVIDKVSLSDSGVYTCHANNSMGRDSIQTEVVVYGKFAFSVQDLLLYRLVLCCNQNDSRLYDIYISSFYSAPLSVYMEPESQTVDVGKEVIIRCRIVGSPIRSVQWTRDGSLVKIGGRYSLLAKDILRIESVSRSDRGIFQCLVRNDRESAQGSSQLKIGESEPQFLSTFAEQVLEPGGRISLKW